MTGLELLVALGIVVGLVGVVVPLLPGSALVGGAVLVWALVTGGGTAWLVLGVVAALLAVGAVVKYVVPGRRLRSAGVPRSSLLVGAALGVVGFFVVPVVGLVLGFLLGVLLAEWRRQGDPARASASTWHAVRAVGLGVLIELGFGLLAAGAWFAGVLTT